MPLNILFYIPSICLASYVFLFFLLLKGQKDKLLVVYFLHTVSLIVWALGASIGRSGILPPLIFWQRFYCYGLILTPFTFYHFVVILCKPNYRKYEVIIPYSFVPLFYIVNFKGYIVRWSYLDNNGQIVYGLGLGAVILGIASVILVLICILYLQQSLLKKKLPLKSIVLIYAGIVILLISSLLNFIPAVGQYSLDFVANTINAFLIAYAIYRYKFFNISIRMKSGITFIIIGTAAACLISSLAFVLTEKSSIPIYVFLFSVTIFLLLPAFQRNYLSLIERIASGRLAYIKDYLNSYIKEISTVLDRSILSEKMVGFICRGFGVSKAIVYLYDYDNDNYTVNYNKNIGKNVPIRNLDSSDSFVLIVQRLDFPATVHELISSPIDKNKALSEQISFLNEASIELIAPIKKGSLFLGFILLSDKPSADPYSRDDIKAINDIIIASISTLENSYMYEKIRLKANKDYLTDLYNERYLIEYIEKHIVENSLKKLSLALIDIDNFKIINAILGYDSGDITLQYLSKAAKRFFPIECTVCRLYKDTFAIALPGVDSQASYEIIEKFRSYIYQDQKEVQFTLSCGLSTFPNDTDNKNDLLIYSRKALETAKNIGRNKTITFPVLMRKSKLIEKIQTRTKDITMQAIFSLVETINQRDSYTKKHSESVAGYAFLLAEYIGLSSSEAEKHRIAGLLHDIGKIGIGEKVLSKPGRLTDEEYAIMKTHVLRGIEILKNFPALKDILPLIAAHHERHDGKGYPYGLKGASIPAGAKILSIADSFDAMTTDRPYKKGVALDLALKELQNCAGSQFDPYLVECFCKMVEKNKELGLSLDEAVVING